MVKVFLSFSVHQLQRILNKKSVLLINTHQHANIGPTIRHLHSHDLLNYPANELTNFRICNRCDSVIHNVIQFLHFNKKIKLSVSVILIYCQEVVCGQTVVSIILLDAVCNVLAGIPKLYKGLHTCIV